MQDRCCIMVVNLQQFWRANWQHLDGWPVFHCILLHMDMSFRIHLKPRVLLLPSCSHSFQWCLLISGQAYFLHYETWSWCHAMICRIDIGSATILHLGNFLELTSQFSKHKASEFVLNRVYWNEMLRASQTWPSIVGLYLYKPNSVNCFPIQKKWTV